MTRPHLLLLAFVLLTAAVRVDAGGKSDSKVKATATATKPDVDGKQTVTITLEIEKGFWLFANPVNHDLLEDAETKVKVTAKEKLKAYVKYPAGTRKKDGRYSYDIYEGVVKIEAHVVRTKGDSSPLNVNVTVHAFSNVACFIPATIKLTVP